MEGNNRLKIKKNILISVIWIIIGFMYYCLYHVVCVKNPVADFEAHSHFAKMYYEDGFRVMYPGFHIIVGGLYQITKIEPRNITVIVMVIASLLSIYLTQLLLKKLFNKISDIYNLVSALCINTIQPIFTYAIRPGYNSGNGYVSPTQTMCKPFVLWALLLFYTSYEYSRQRHCVNRDVVNEEKSICFVNNQVLLTMVLILSCIVKPMFAMAFIPAMGLLLVSDLIKDSFRLNIKENVKVFVGMVMPLFVTGLFLIGQYIYGTTIHLPEGVRAGVDGDTHIRVGFLYAWHMVVDSVGLSVLMAYAFPIMLLLFVLISKMILLKGSKTTDYKRVENKGLNNYWKMCAFYGAVSFLYISMLYQDNGYEADMNFRNCWIITFLMVYVGAIGYMFQEVTAGMKDGEIIGFKSIVKAFIDRKELTIPFIVFLVQMAMGAALILKNVLVI